MSRNELPASCLEVHDGVSFVKMRCPACRETYLLAETFYHELFDEGAAGPVETVKKNTCTHCGWNLLKMMEGLP